MLCLLVLSLLACAEKEPEEGSSENQEQTGTPSEQEENILTSWARIPAGTFVSSLTGEEANISSFLIQKTAVNAFDLYDYCGEKDDCFIEAYTEENARVPTLCGGGHISMSQQLWPANCVSHQTASDYCESIGARLPTADEWEYAASHDGNSAQKKKYAWGDDEPTQCVTANYAIPDDNGDPIPCKPTTNIHYHWVDDYPQGDTPLGLRNMSGNVAEWTSTTKIIMNEDNGEEVEHYIIKGGSGLSLPEQIELSAYDTAAPDTISTMIGFRCIKDIQD